MKSLQNYIFEKILINKNTKLGKSKYNENILDVYVSKDLWDCYEIIEKYFKKQVNLPKLSLMIWDYNGEEIFINHFFEIKIGNDELFYIASESDMLLILYKDKKENISHVYGYESNEHINFTHETVLEWIKRCDDSKIKGLFDLK